MPAFAPLPRQQSIRRDLALITPESVSHDALDRRAAQHARTRCCARSQLFDVYKPPAGGERSMAVHLELRDDNATLTDERIDAALAQILDHVQTRLGVRLRS